MASSTFYINDSNNFVSSTNFTIGNTNKIFTNQQEISWSVEEIGAVVKEKITTATDFNTLTRTGLYSIAINNSPNSPLVPNHGLLTVVTDLGTPFQTFEQDNSGAIYKRWKNNDTGEWRDWVLVRDNLTNYVKRSGDTMTGRLIIQPPDYTSINNGPILQVINSHSSGGGVNNSAALFQNLYGTHDWGTVANFNIQQLDKDKPSIRFSCGNYAAPQTEGTTSWSIGFCTGTVGDYSFKIRKNLGWDGWGDEVFRIEPSGIASFAGPLRVKNHQLYIMHTGITKGTLPTATTYWTLNNCDKDNTAYANALGQFETSLSTAGLTKTHIRARQFVVSTASSIATAELYVSVDINGVMKSGSNCAFYGAVWNDYAEFRQTKQGIEPGRVVIETGKEDLVLSSKRLQPGANIVSDTYGFAIGETDECKTPLAVAGRALVYTYEDRYSYEPGEAVCSGPNGTISKMTREEIKEYPERIIGTVSEIPEYDTWGTGNVKVDNRIWIKIK